MNRAVSATELRCVILTDFIRKAEMPKSTDELAVCEDIGIVPIFEYLRRAALSDIRLGVLSGSLVIIPSSAEPLLRQAATALGIDPRDLSISPLIHDPGYSSVEIRGRILSRLSSLDHIGFPAGRNNRASRNEILAGGRLGRAMHQYAGTCQLCWLLCSLEPDEGALDPSGLSSATENSQYLASRLCRAGSIWSR